MSGKHDVWVEATFGVHPSKSASSGPSSQEKQIARIEHSLDLIDEQIAQLTASGVDGGPLAVNVQQLRKKLADLREFDDPDPKVQAAALTALEKEARKAAAVAVKDAQKQAHTAVEGADAAIKAIRDGANKEIQKLKDGDDKTALTQRLSDLDAALKEAEKVQDRAERAKAFADLNTTAEQLLDDATKAGTGSQDDPEVQGAYKKAITKKYGVNISNPSGTKNTHYDQVYKMFDKVPIGDVTQQQFKKLSYEGVTYDKKGNPKSSGAAYGDAEISMGEYKTGEKWGYQDPKTGKPAPSNGFSISTLHELGHSVDDRFGIMSANQGKAGGGGWKPETVDSVAGALVSYFLKNAGSGIDFDIGAVLKLAKTALQNGKINEPKKGTEKDHWDVLQPFLKECAGLKSEKWAWQSPKNIDGRTYHEAYPGQWWSIDFAVRNNAAIKVRDYMWRAPGEWFAELYAWTWFKSDTPPNGVDPAIAAYMYGGKSAAPPGAKP